MKTTPLHRSLFRPAKIALAFLAGCYGAACHAADWYVKPDATGTGSGTSAANAADYLNATFWTSVQSALASGSQIVHFADGTYNDGKLNLDDKGHPANLLSLIADNDHAAVLSVPPDTDAVISMKRTQNIYMRGLRITGANATSWGIVVQGGTGSNKKPARGLEFHWVQFDGLTSTAYGALGLLDGTRDVYIHRCDFSYIGIGGGAHCIYGSHHLTGIRVDLCNFYNCKGQYVRFRDDSDYCTVTNSNFRSTSSTYNQPFIHIPIYNDGDGDEYYGTNFQFTGNDFVYDTTAGTGWRTGVSFDCNGYTSPGYDFTITSSEADTLNNGTVAAKRSLLLSDMGIDMTKVFVYSNTLTNVNGHVRMGYFHNYGSPSTGWTGFTNITNAVASSGTMPVAPKIRNGDFGTGGSRLRMWRVFSATAPAAAIGLNGSNRGIQFEKASTQEVGQWVCDTTSTFTTECLFAIGAFTGTGVKFSVQVYHNEYTGARLEVGVNNAGQFGYYNGSTFTVLSGLGTVQFSTDANNDGDYQDTGDAIRFYKLRIVGDYSGATPTFDLYTSDANSTTLNHSALGISAWVSGNAVTGSRGGLINFKNVTADVLLDAVTWQ